MKVRFLHRHARNCQAARLLLFVGSAKEHDQEQKQQKPGMLYFLFISWCVTIAMMSTVIPLLAREAMCHCAGECLLAFFCMFVCKRIFICIFLGIGEFRKQSEHPCTIGAYLSYKTFAYSVFALLHSCPRGLCQDYSGH